MATVFLAYFEKKSLQNSPSDFKHYYYRSYVDVFVLFSSPEHLEAFRNFTNSQHANISFTFKNDHYFKNVHYFKLPYIGNISHHVKNKFSKLCKEFCTENFNINSVFTSFKIKNYFSYKDLIPDDLISFLVHKFTCACCSSGYIGETCHHFNTRIEEHIKKDKKSHIFKHLHSTATFFDFHNSLSFKIIDKDNSKFDFKIKEALHINWRKP